MSIADYQGKPTDLPRDRLAGMYWLMHSRQKTRKATEWRRLAALTLREVGEWSLEAIGAALGLHKGNVLRQIEAAKRDLREGLTAEELRSAVSTDESAAREYLGPRSSLKMNALQLEQRPSTGQLVKLGRFSGECEVTDD